MASIPRRRKLRPSPRKSHHVHQRIDAHALRIKLMRLYQQDENYQLTVAQKLRSVWKKHGLSERFREIQSLSLPPTVDRHLDQRRSTPADEYVALLYDYVERHLRLRERAEHDGSVRGAFWALEFVHADVVNGRFGMTRKGRAEDHYPKLPAPVPGWAQADVLHIMRIELLISPFFGDVTVTYGGQIVPIPAPVDPDGQAPVESLRDIAHRAIDGFFDDADRRIRDSANVKTRYLSPAQRTPHDLHVLFRHLFYKKSLYNEEDDLYAGDDGDTDEDERQRAARERRREAAVHKRVTRLAERIGIELPAD